MDTSLRTQVGQSVINAAKQQQTATTAGQQQYNTDADAAAAAKTGQAAAETDAGTQAATIAQQSGSMQMASDSYMQKIASALGIGDNSNAEALVGLAGKFASARDNLVQQTQNVNDLNSVGPFDDPLKWLSNTLALPAAKQQLQAAASTVDVTGKALDSTFTAGQQAAQTIIATRAKTNAAIVNAQAQQALDTAQSQAQATTAQAYQWRAQDVQANMAFDAQKVASMESQYRVYQNEDSWQLQQRTAARQDELAQLQIDKIKKDASMDQGAYQDMVNRVQAVAAQNGVQLTMPATSEGMQAAMKYNPQLEQQVRTFNSMSIAQAATGVASFGTDPATAFFARQAAGVKLTQPGEQATANMVQSVWNQMQGAGVTDALGNVMKDGFNQPLYKIDPKTTKEAAVQMLNSAIATKMSQTPPQLPAIGAVTSSFKDMDSWPLFQALKPLDTGPTSPLQVGNIQDLTKLGIAAYKAGQISVGDLAKNLGDYSLLASRKLNQDAGYQRQGIQPLTQVPVQLGTHTVDLATTAGQLAVMQYAILQKKPGLLTTYAVDPSSFIPAAPVNMDAGAVANRKAIQQTNSDMDYLNAARAAAATGAKQ